MYPALIRNRSCASSATSSCMPLLIFRVSCWPQEFRQLIDGVLPGIPLHNRRWMMVKPQVSGRYTRAYGLKASGVQSRMVCNAARCSCMLPAISVAMHASSKTLPYACGLAKASTSFCRVFQ